ncbi:MAG: DUF3619 family protein [Lautropia sp.]|nr:DUF3619 family protein [Lautropia sp.]
MNQDRIASRICRLLDEAADELPVGLQSRLATARRQALARLDAPPARKRSGFRLVLPALGAPPTARAPTPLWIKFAVAVLPAVMLMIGVLIGNLFSHERTVAAQADAYTEMLTDDPPLAAYTDRGFANHLQRVGLNAHDHARSHR